MTAQALNRTAYGFALVLICLSLPSRIAADEMPSAEQILAGLSFPPGVEVRFTQSQLNPLLRRVSRQEGVMRKSVDRGLVMTVTAPRPEERTLHDGFVTLTRANAERRNPGRRSITRRKRLDPSSPADLALLALQALLYGNTVTLHQHFELTTTVADSEGWRILLVPRAEDVRARLSRLRLSGMGQHLMQFRSERDDAAGKISHWLEVRIDPTEAPPNDHASS